MIMKAVLNRIAALGDADSQFRFGLSASNILVPF